MRTYQEFSAIQRISTDPNFRHLVRWERNGKVRYTCTRDTQYDGGQPCGIRINSCKTGQQVRVDDVLGTRRVIETIYDISANVRGCGECKGRCRLK